MASLTAVMRSARVVNSSEDRVRLDELEVAPPRASLARAEVMRSLLAMSWSLGKCLEPGNKGLSNLDPGATSNGGTQYGADLSRADSPGGQEGGQSGKLRVRGHAGIRQRCDGDSRHQFTHRT